MTQWLNAMKNDRLYKRLSVTSEIQTRTNTFYLPLALIAESVRQPSLTLRALKKAETGEDRETLILTV